MPSLFKTSLMLTATLVITICGGCDIARSTANGNKNKPTKISKNHSAAEIENRIKSALTAQYGKIAEAEYYLASSDNSSPNTVPSSTNLQESNVDEADRLKTDGKYLYFSAVNDPSINILKVEKGAAPVVSKLNIKTIDNTPLSGIYLLSEKSKIVALADDRQHNLSIWNNWFNTSFWQARKTELFSVDISDPSAPAQTDKLTLDGQLISSRRIGTTLYLATRHTPDIDGLHHYPTNEGEVTNNEQLIAKSSLASFLPRYAANDQSTSPLFSANDCFVTDTNQTNQQLSVISLLAINLNNVNEKPTGECFVGDTETVYASSEAIYLATTQHSYSESDSGIRYDKQTSTDIHKFSIADITPSYIGSGTVAGHLGWQQDLKAFRMNEHEGVLRVVTYVGEHADSNDSPARLYTLVENSTEQTLETLAQLPNEARPEPLGKVGEQIYASRFIGDRGYLVTFNLTDPLYIIDLSDPSDPFIASALEVDGYSDYLHPVGENYLLGVGKSALANTAEDGSIGDGRGAWYQGVKLSLFDISDPSAPFEKQTINIGKRGTKTAASCTHHALTSLLKGDTLQIALPVSLHETVNEQYAEYVNEPWYTYQWTRNELQRLNIDTVNGEITTLAAVTNTAASPDPHYDWSWPHDRSVLIGESAYYLNEDTVTVQ